jgi:hypothetical protein
VSQVSSSDYQDLEEETSGIKTTGALKQDNFSNCSIGVIWFLWNVRLSSHESKHSVLANISASLHLITGWSMRRFPNAFRWTAHL